MLGAAKHQSGFAGVLLDIRFKQPRFITLGRVINTLDDFLDRFAWWGYLHFNWITQISLGQIFDQFWHRSREKHRLALKWNMASNFTQRMNKSHV